MRIRYHTLRQLPVRTRDGTKLGRVTDLVAERRHDSLRVTGLLVGPSGIVRRIVAARGPFLRWTLPRFVPWDCVEKVDGEIRLSIDLDELDSRHTPKTDRRPQDGKERA